MLPEQYRLALGEATRKWFDEQTPLEQFENCVWHSSTLKEYIELYDTIEKSWSTFNAARQAEYQVKLIARAITSDWCEAIAGIDFVDGGVRPELGENHIVVTGRKGNERHIQINNNAHGIPQDEVDFVVKLLKALEKDEHYAF